MIFTKYEYIKFKNLIKIIFNNICNKDLIIHLYIRNNNLQEICFTNNNFNIFKIIQIFNDKLTIFHENLDTNYYYYNLRNHFINYMKLIHEEFNSLFDLVNYFEKIFINFDNNKDINIIYQNDNYKNRKLNKYY